MILPEDREHLQREGYLLIRRVLSPSRVASLLHELPEGAAGLRKALQWPAVSALSLDPTILRLIEDLAGEPLTPVRGLLFNKTPNANWAVGWHQDLALALRERRDVEGFGPWSVKAGVPHAHAPAWLLERMITLRFHLDRCTNQEGPLRVVPRSHRQGRMSSSEAAEWERQPGVTCLAEPGDALAMPPLLLHASHSAAEPTRRRVLHLEYGPAPLPGGLEWARA
ncbi:MAG: phytanoyl-CoA dioxygenase family protein [Verrucomicrobia bacterium]|nr:phytanoyl-CoA dioxygenase family protein [Verrucomicrobiota bacterium]MBI3867182.1 phytanoyl-CoA dioxygenase family protein [Verrucomicrobiota bacterium]